MKKILLFAVTLLMTMFPVVRGKYHQTKKPLKVIFLIGDGMGLAQITSALAGYEGQNAFKRFKVVGLSNTSSDDNYVTDSGAGATAFSIGRKTRNHAIGVDADSIAYPTLFEMAKKKRIATGVVATSSVVHATPASFFAHHPNRRKYEKLAEALLDGNCDIAIGGGYRFFAQRSDKRNLLEEMKGKGFEVYTDSSKWKDISSSRMLYLSASDGMPRMLDGRGDFLKRGTFMAIKNLERNPQGFMLMIEGSQIDWGGHAMDYEYMKSELIDFNEVVNAVLDYAHKDGNTLVVVTADHETGGLALKENPTQLKSFIPHYTYNEHTGIMVPVFAFGPGAEAFGGVYENTEIFYKFSKAMHLAK
jgi:alkaline phosphatase